MRLHILSLPTSILLLIASQAAFATSAEDDSSPAQWPQDLPPHVKFWPEDPPNRRRDLEAIEEHLRLGRRAVGVMKMPADEGEKFYMEFWQFEGDLGQTNPLGAPTMAQQMRAGGEEEGGLSANVSIPVPFKPAFLLHAGDLKAREGSARALVALQKRDFVCPTGTSACTGIGFSESCCTTGDQCYQIPESGLGQVGCCPAGATCGGSITHCDAPNTPCSVALGGGCCIPNYVCVEGGCAFNSSLIVTTVITQTITLFGSPPTIITSTSTSTLTSSSTASACPLNVQSCAASLGGGCCPSDRVCALSSCAPLPPSSTTTVVSTKVVTTTPTSTATGAVPVRPIPGTSSSIETTTTSDAVTSCPTGFYACEAFYQGGCCRTGRNCQKTSCPPIASTTIVSNGLTIAVPTGPAALLASPTGACATGWSTCPPSVGGNCCPSGWNCGTASCSSIAASTTAVAQKESPGGAGRSGRDFGLIHMIMACIVGVLML